MCIMRRLEMIQIQDLKLSQVRFLSRGVSNRCFEVRRVCKFETKQLSVGGVWSWLLPV